MSGWFIVGLVGALGATSRHAIDIGMRRLFPTGPSVGILVVNILGSLALGVLVGRSMVAFVDPDLRLAIGVGFCGAFTTFSTFAAELAAMAQRRAKGLLVGWTAAMVLGGGFAAYAGVSIGRS